MSSNTKRLIRLYDPVTENFRSTLEVASTDEVAQTAKRAKEVFFNEWSEVSYSSRIALVEKLARVLEDKRDALANTISRELGAPIDFCHQQQVGTGLGHIQATVEAAKQNPEDIPFLTDDERHRLRYEPVGVAALITPWNWPFNQVVLKVIPALIAGCTTILKPSELASDTALLFAQCVKEAGFPDDVFQILIGDGETGGALVMAPEVDIISFTGSTSVGRKIAAVAGQNLKRTVLELGGKSPNIIFADCDLPKAMTQGLAHCFRNSGQSCNAASWMLIERPIYEEAILLAREIADSYESGLPHEPGKHLGPLISKDQYDRVQSFIKAGLDDGPRLVTGGLGRPDNRQSGWYVKPTVFADTKPGMAIVDNEIFGPILCITPFESEEEVIQLANESDFGLSGFIQTDNTKKANRIAKKLHVGMVQINGSSRAPGTAFGGVKQSGIGREAGLFGIRAFQEIKSISGVENH